MPSSSFMSPSSFYLVVSSSRRPALVLSLVPLSFRLSFRCSFRFSSVGSFSLPAPSTREAGRCFHSMAGGISKQGANGHGGEAWQAYGRTK